MKKDNQPKADRDITKDGMVTGEDMNQIVGPCHIDDEMARKAAENNVIMPDRDIDISEIAEGNMAELKITPIPKPTTKEKQAIADNLDIQESNKGRSLAKMFLRLKQVLEEKKDANESYNEVIKNLRKSIDKLAQEIQSGQMSIEEQKEHL